MARLTLLLGTVLSAALLVFAFLLVSRDRSRRAKAAEQVQQERERLMTTLLGIGDGVIVADAAGRVSLMNPVAQMLTGWGSEAAGRPVAEVFPIVNEQTRREVENPVERCLREGVVVGLANHTVLISRDGVERPIDDSGAPIRLPSGEVTGAVLIFRDVSERRRSEQALAERARLAEFAAAVGASLTRHASLADMLRRCAEAVVKHLDAAFARVWTLNEAEQMLELQASAGLYTHLDGPHGRVPVGQYKIGLIAQERKPHLTNAVAADPRVSDPEWRGARAWSPSPATP